LHGGRNSSVRSGVGLPASVCYIFRPSRNRKHGEGVRDQSAGAAE
jgi:hypothetical protein